MKVYTIELEDKAAFINLLDKANIPVDSYDITDDKIKGYFKFTTTNPETDKIVKDILNKSKVTRLKEAIRAIIRKELLK